MPTHNLTDQQIETAIDTIELESQSDINVFGGHCLEIATAIQDVLSGKLIFCTQVEGEGFEHALVDIDGTLYDGSGHVFWSETVDRFILKEQYYDDIERHFFYPHTIHQYSFDTQIYETVMEQLSEIVKEMND